jgi:hypothetical protein
MILVVVTIPRLGSSLHCYWLILGPWVLILVVMVFLCIDHGCVGLVVHSHDWSSLWFDLDCHHLDHCCITTLVLITIVLHLWSHSWLHCYFNLDYGHVVHLVLMAITMVLLFLIFFLLVFIVVMLFLLSY